jgi:hypothetical protein
VGTGGELLLEISHTVNSVPDVQANSSNTNILLAFYNHQFASLVLFKSPYFMTSSLSWT